MGIYARIGIAFALALACRHGERGVARLFNNATDDKRNSIQQGVGGAVVLKIRKRRCGSVENTKKKVRRQCFLRRRQRVSPQSKPRGGAL